MLTVLGVVFSRRYSSQDHWGSEGHGSWSHQRRYVEV